MATGYIGVFSSCLKYFIINFRSCESESGRDDVIAKKFKKLDYRKRWRH